MPRLDYYADFLAATQRIDEPGEVLVLDGWSKILEPSPDGWWPDEDVGKTDGNARRATGTERPRTGARSSRCHSDS